MNLVYNVGDRPKTKQIIVFAFQQMIAIMAATLLVPMLMSSYAMSDGVTSLSFDPAAALFGAGIGTLVYVLFSKRRSPVFLGSSFTFLGAYAAVIGKNYGYWGIILGVLFAGLVYVVFALIIKGIGSRWVNRLMPAVIIGPIVTLIGLSLSSTATNWVMANGHSGSVSSIIINGEGATYNWVAILVGLFTFAIIVIASVKGSKTLKLIPFIVGIGAGFALALVLTLIGQAANLPYLKIMDFSAIQADFVPFTFRSILDYPKFVFLKAFQTNGMYPINGAALGNIALTFIPIAVVELAQHIGDHKNLGNIIEKDLITDPGLDNTLLGDGIGSIVGAFFGGAANTTYGESIACVALTGNASIITIIYASLGCMLLSFFTPFVALINSIPKCVMGGACIALYGFIAVSGLQMFKKVDLNDNRNLYVISAILVVGIGGMTFEFGVNPVTNTSLISLTPLAAALIIGILTKLIIDGGKMKADDECAETVEETVSQK